MNAVAVSASEVPQSSLLSRYEGQPFGFVDAYTATLPNGVSLRDYIEAFYNSWVFRPERLLIGLVLRRPADAAAVAGLASGSLDTFSAWTVEERKPAEILLRDINGATRSWLCVERLPGGGTRLWFGSAVVPRKDAAGNPQPPSGLFDLLTGFHRLYSRMLLGAAVRGLR